MVLFWAEPMLAQSDSSRLTPMDSLVISARSNQILRGLESVPVHAFLQQAVTLRTEGPGQIASVSIPGFSSRQTDFIWNGFSLQSPSGISVDFGQVPIALFDQTGLVDNNPTGENGISGKGISVRTEPISNSAVQAELVGGSFGYFQKIFKLHSQKNNYHQSYRLLLQRAKNNYPIPGRDGIQLHAATSIAALITSHRFERKHGKTKLEAWLQFNTMDIPASALAAKSEAFRNDRDVRFTHMSEEQVGKGTVEVAQLVNAEWDYFEDPLSSVVSPLQFVTIKNRLGYRSDNTGFLTSKLFFHRMDATVQSPNVDYSGVFSIQTIEGEVSTLEKKQLSGGINLRQLHRGNSNRFAPKIFLNARSENKRWTVGLKASKRVRFPLLADMHWYSLNAVGNPDLNVEEVRHLQCQVGLVYPKFKVKVSAHHDRATNLINWLNTVDGVLFPINEDEIIITGGQVNYHIQLGKRIKWNATGHYQLNRAIDDKTGVQRIFAPVHQGYSRLTMEIDRFSLSYGLNAQSEVFLNKSHTQNLVGYAIHEAESSYRINELFQVGLSIHNLSNQYYELSPNFPMPGRAIYITVKYYNPIKS